MKKVSYILALVMVILWVIGYFSHTIGPSVHYLLAGALILILINIIQENKIDSQKKPSQTKTKTL